MRFYKGYFFLISLSVNNVVTKTEFFSLREELSVEVATKVEAAVKPLQTKVQQLGQRVTSLDRYSEQEVRS